MVSTSDHNRAALGQWLATEQHNSSPNSHSLMGHYRANLDWHYMNAYSSLPTNSTPKYALPGFYRYPQQNNAATNSTHCQQMVSSCTNFAAHGDPRHTITPQNNKAVKNQASTQTEPTKLDYFKPQDRHQNTVHYRPCVIPQVINVNSSLPAIRHNIIKTFGESKIIPSVIISTSNDGFQKATNTSDNSGNVHNFQKATNASDNTGNVHNFQKATNASDKNKFGNVLNFQKTTNASDKNSSGNVQHFQKAINTSDKTSSSNVHNFQMVSSTSNEKDSGHVSNLLGIYSSGKKTIRKRQEDQNNTQNKNGQIKRKRSKPTDSLASFKPSRKVQKEMYRLFSIPPGYFVPSGLYPNSELTPPKEYFYQHSSTDRYEPQHFTPMKLPIILPNGNPSINESHPQPVHGNHDSCQFNATVKQTQGNFPHDNNKELRELITNGSDRNILSGISIHSPPCSIPAGHVYIDKRSEKQPSLMEPSLATTLSVSKNNLVNVSGNNTAVDPKVTSKSLTNNYSLQCSPENQYNSSGIQVLDNFKRCQNKVCSVDRYCALLTPPVTPDNAISSAPPTPPASSATTAASTTIASSAASALSSLSSTSYELSTASAVSKPHTSSAPSAVFKPHTSSSPFNTSNEASPLKENLTHWRSIEFNKDKNTVNTDAQELSTAKLFTCHICPYQIEKLFNFQLHMAQHYTNRDKLIPINVSRHKLRCGICGYFGTDEKDLDAHVGEHVLQKRFVCRYCDMDFEKKGEVRRHIRRTHGEMVVFYDRRKIYQLMVRQAQMMIPINPVVMLDRDEADQYMA